MRLPWGHSRTCFALVAQFGVRASVSKASLNQTPIVKQRSKRAAGQQLMLDLVTCPADILNSKEKLVHTVTAVSAELEVDVARIDVTKLIPEGYGIVANWGDSHMAIHTWPPTGDALVNVFISDEDNEENLKELLPILSMLLGGNLTRSTYSIIPRGKDVDVFDNDAFAPAEIMTRHQYKQLVSEVQSPFQNVAIWDHHDELSDEFTMETTRSLFLDGVMQSSISDEYLYHETLVQPAFIASAAPPKRVLIVGGGEGTMRLFDWLFPAYKCRILSDALFLCPGGTLRETLKWKSVEEAVMVDLDAQVVESSREFLPTYNNCTGFGTANCFDDPRVKLYTTDFFKWFDDHIGSDICEKREKKQDLLFDVIILDLLDTEELPEGQAWAQYLYSKLFFERIACTATDLGVVVSNFGEAPESPFEPDLVDIVYPDTAMDVPQEGLSRSKMFLRKIEQLRSFSYHFNDFRVFDAYVPAFRAPWAFAMGIVPRFSKEPDEKKKIGISYFDGTPVQIQHKLRQGLISKGHMEHYSGSVQQMYKQPYADWDGVFCDHSAFKELCSFHLRFFDDESKLWKVEVTENEKSVKAVSDLHQGDILGAWDLVFADSHKIVDAMGKSCEPNTAILKEHEPMVTDTMWNPALKEIEAQVDAAVILLRDVKAGESLTRKGSDC